MKQITSKTIAVTPYVIGIAIITYIIEKVLEDVVSEAVSDFVYPVAGLLILGLIWKTVIPVAYMYLRKAFHNFRYSNE